MCPPTYAHSPCSLGFENYHIHYTELRSQDDYHVNFKIPDWLLTLCYYMPALQALRIKSDNLAPLKHNGNK